MNSARRWLLKSSILLGAMAAISVCSGEESPTVENEDSEKIRNTVQIYFDGMYESNAEKIYEAFHPNAKITGYSSQTGNLLEMSVDDFANRVASLQPSMKEQGAAILLEILSIEIAGSTAAVRVRDAYRSLIFLDTLSFLKIDGEWKIYNKLYHVES